MILEQQSLNKLSNKKEKDIKIFMLKSKQERSKWLKP